MRNRQLVIALAAVLFAAQVVAQDGGTSKPGPQTQLLGALVGKKTYGWTKKMPPNGRLATLEGKLLCKWVADGFWISCEGEEKKTPGGGHKYVFVMGYDVHADEYRALAGAPGGIALIFTGKLEGKKVVLTSADVVGRGGKARARWTFDFTDPSAVKQTDERSLDGAPFNVFDEYVFH